MQISALFGIASPQAGVPMNGTPAGFEMLIEQLLAAGGPEPPGSPPGELIPCGEKLTTLEPNAQSIQPDSAADAQTTNLSFHLAMSQLTAAGIAPVPQAPSLPVQVDVSPLVSAPLEVAPAHEQAALKQLLQQPDLGITRLTVDQAPAAPKIEELPVTPGIAVGPEVGMEARPAEKAVAAASQSNTPVGLTKNPEVVRPATSQTGIDPNQAPQVEAVSAKVAGPPVRRETQFELLQPKPSSVSESAEFASNAESSFAGSDTPSQSDEPTHRDAQPKSATIEPTANLRSVQETKPTIAERPAPNHQLVRDLADRIEMALATRPQDRVTIEFRPLDLGDIKIVLTQQNDQVQAQIISDNDRVRQAIHAVQPELRQSLEQRGVQLGSFSVSDFGSHHEPNRQQPNPQPHPQTPAAFREPANMTQRPVAVATRTGGVDLSI